MLGHREAYVARQAAATHGPAPSRTPAKDSWFGLKAGVGTDWRLGQAFGLTLGGRYQWTEFGEDVGGQRIFNGLGADLGLTYRFQYQ
ncbi:MAG: hypothetical protein E6K78_05020 [Candidatus Eisenbacteria bacterium]|uniref:Porin family protein n=1 Tax=Eiseniibacteriota bacterium TaxID=2212470 RepID=A0A538TV08_UNCEI|nr:MAG: hypothetical protein E6K78_05020 [Candidatus Eisenbacteria bacterium]